MRCMPDTQPNTIEIKNLSKHFGNNKALDCISFNVPQGSICGFLGPNGAGKSTTIRTLLGLLKPTDGSASIFGKDIQYSGPEIREEIGYLPSEVFYYDAMRAIDLLRYSASFYKSKSQTDIESRMKYLADLLKLDLHQKIDDLSYGNKKKVGIIQGLQHLPKLIILDEPTGGLDPLIQQTFFKLIQDEHKRGATVLFSSHILSEVHKLCDRVVIIKQGKIIKVERMEDLRRNSYAKVRIELSAPLEKTFPEIAGISNLNISKRRISFLFRGDINAITKLAATMKLSSIWIEEPDLEEIFMHYYQSDTQKG